MNKTRTPLTAMAEKMSEENNLPVEVNQAYINIVGEQYAKPEEAEDAYIGEFRSDEDFAQDMADQLGLIDNEIMKWPHNCIDWEQAARDLMYDYSEDGGHYFRNL